MTDLRQAPAQPEQELSWIDSIKSGDRVLYDGDGATVFSVLRQRPLAPDYFKLDFDDGSYIDINDNDLIANGKPLYTAPVDAVNMTQKRVDETAKGEHDRAVELAQAYERGWNAALAQSEHEPVAWRNKETGEFCSSGFLRKEWAQWTPLYTAPPKREWVGLTGLEQKEFMAMNSRYAVFETEAKLKEKNT